MPRASMVACCLAFISFKWGYGLHGWRVAELVLSVLGGAFGLHDAMYRCSFLSLILLIMLALSANNRKCACQRTYDADGDHILTCCRHLATRIRGHNHIQDCPVS